MINYGLVGIGGFGAAWVHCLQALEAAGLARLSAAAERDRAANAEGASALEARGCPVYSSLEELLARHHAPLHVIGIATGIAYHEPLATLALEAGHDVHIEKPVAGTVQEVAHLCEVTQRTNHWCAVGYQWLHSPTIQWIGARLASGDLGPLREARSMIGWPRAASYYARNAWAGQLRDGGRWVLDGPATNATAHYLTNILYLAGVRLDGPPSIAAVRAELYRAKPTPSYDTSCLEVTLSSGVRLLHYATHALSRPWEPVMDLYAAKGSIHWQAEGDMALLRYADGREERFANPSPAANHVRSFEQVARVAAGQEPAPLCGLAEGGPHVLTINLAFESAREIVTVPDEYTYQARDAEGSSLVGIRGMEEVLQEAQATGRLFSELGVPWARKSAEFPAEGYRSFPVRFGG